jgi:hypothetical protein
MNGFRAWTDCELPKHFIKCPCGWSGLPHYASNEYVRHIRRLLAKLGSVEKLDLYMKKQLIKHGAWWDIEPGDDNK